MAAEHSMTPLSRSSVLDSWTMADLPAVARLSLMLVVTMMIGVPSCLVTHATEFPPPAPTKPFLDPNLALATVGSNPVGVPVTKMIFIDPGPDPQAEIPQINFVAPVQSEDNGQKLTARVFLDWKVSGTEGSEQFGGGATIDPGTFDEVRIIDGRLNLRPGTRGCHQVAMVVSHLFDPYNFEPVWSTDTGFLVWWLLIEHPGTEQFPASQCPPGRDTPQLDGGAEAAVQ